MIQKQVLEHSSISKFGRGVEASGRKPGNYDIMVPIRGEFSGKRVVSWVRCCRKIESDEKREASIDFEAWGGGRN